MIRILVLARLVWLETLRRKDLYVLLILMAGFLLALAGVGSFGVSGRVVYLKELGLLLTWLMVWILAVTVSARQLPQEERRGTIYALLAKPVGRGEMVAGKWLGAWTVTCAAALVFYALLGGVVALAGGAFDGRTLAQALALHGALLAVIAGLGVAVSTRLHADAAAALTFLVSLAAWLLPGRAPALAEAAPGGARTALVILYYALPHGELFDMRRRLAFGWGPAPGEIVAAVLAYGGVLTVLLLTLGWLGYRRKRFVRGALI